MTYIALLGGGFFVIYLLAALWEVLLFKRVMDDPVKGKVGSVVAAYLTASLLSMLAGAGVIAFLYYVFAAAVLGTFAYRRGIALRQNPQVDEEMVESFE